MVVGPVLKRIQSQKPLMLGICSSFSVFFDLSVSVWKHYVFPVMTEGKPRLILLSSNPFPENCPA
jgi:hypothetical protein